MSVSICEPMKSLESTRFATAEEAIKYANDNMEPGQHCQILKAHSKVFMVEETVKRVVTYVSPFDHKAVKATPDSGDE